jgi:hypothetical protein
MRTFSVPQLADVENVAIMSANKPSETEQLLQRILAKTPTPSRTRRIMGFLARPWAIFVEITGMLAALVVFFEVYLQTIAEIEANNSEPSSILPFSIQNESNFFDMTEVHLSCGIDSAAYEIGNGKWMGMPGPALFGPTQTVPVIRRHGGIVAYPCKASDYIHRNIWDDLCRVCGTSATVVAKRSSISAPRATFSPPNRLTKDEAPRMAANPADEEAAILERFFPYLLFHGFLLVQDGMVLSSMLSFHME